MLCQMELAEQLVVRPPDHSLTLFDKGFYSLGLLHAWQTAGIERHWLLPLKNGTQEVAATAGHGGSPLADPQHKRQGAPSVELDG